MTGKTDGTNLWVYTWSPDEPQLTRVQGPGGVDVSYTYDSAGRLLTRDDGTDVTKFTWDGWTCVKETSGSTVTRYIAPQGQIHSFERGGQVYQVHSDGHNGSVRAITDASGAVVAHYEFDAWGNQLGSSSPFSGGFSYGSFMGSLGVQLDFATGLHYVRRRWYDAELGRFLSRDAVHSANRYSYCVNNPVNWVDVNGLQLSDGPGSGLTQEMIDANPVLFPMVVGGIVGAVFAPVTAGQSVAIAVPEFWTMAAAIDSGLAAGGVYLRGLLGAGLGKLAASYDKHLNFKFDLSVRMSPCPPPKDLYHGSPNFQGGQFDLSKVTPRPHHLTGPGIYLTDDFPKSGDSICYRA